MESGADLLRFRSGGADDFPAEVALRLSVCCLKLATVNGVPSEPSVSLTEGGAGGVSSLVLLSYS